MVTLSQNNPFLKLKSREQEAEKEALVQSGTKNPFYLMSGKPPKPKNEPESLGKSTLRTAMQVPQGYAEGTPFGIATSLWQQIGLGESLDPEEIERIKEISEREGIPFDEEKYIQAAHAAAGTIPTVGNIASLIEKHTGAPLEAKTDLQKGIRIGSTAGKAIPGATIQKAVAAVTAPSISYGAKKIGVPEPIADIIGLATSGAVASKVPAYNVNVGPKTKPSGLTERRFENVKETRKISENRKQRITENLENDFKKISDDIIDSGPIAKTRQQLSENPKFKQDISEKFGEVEKLSEAIPETVSTQSLKKTLADNTIKKSDTGLMASDYEKDFNSLIKQFIKETKSGNAKPIELVKQYRKNNEALGQYFSPEKSKSQNNAKRDAILEYNKAIAKTIESEFPNSEFSKLFKETNKKWSEIADAEYINSFVENLFQTPDKTAKVPQFNKGKKFFESDKQKKIFTRALGKENFQKFETLMEDLLSTETPYKMLQVAKKQGYSELAKDAGVYIIDPHLGAAKTGLSFGKKAYRSVIDSMLERPKTVVTFKKAVDNVKKGNFAEAEKSFKQLNSEIQ